MISKKRLTFGGIVAIAPLLFACGGTSKSSADAAPHAATPVVDTVAVASRKLGITVRLPGELEAYEVVAVFAKVSGFVDSISVDRGSAVRSGQIMARLVAPEIAAQRGEAQFKLQQAEAQRVEAEARLSSDQSTYERLKAASATPGVVAGNDLEVAQKSVEADRARVQAARESADAAKAALKSITDIEGYLEVRAPFDGVVTERNAHPGTLVGPATGSQSLPLLRVERTAQLRLTVPVPERYVGSVAERAKVAFSVAAFPSQTFSGTVARVAHSVDEKTRTMPVELDVINSGRRLAPGMYAEVLWPVQRQTPTLFVPVTAVARTTEGTFVVRVRSGQVEWVNVQTGEVDGKTIEVFGDLHEGEEVALRGTDELRPGSHVTSRANGN